MIRLRGHHVLCLLGYRGMGYSAEYVENMTRVHQTLRTQPGTRVHLVAGPDDLCARFPQSGTYHCDDAEIHQRDAVILAALDLGEDQQWTWREIQQRIQRTVVPSDVARWCSTCSWLPYGVCQEGVADLRAGRGMTKVE